MTNLEPSFLNKWLVTSCVIESSIACATWFIKPIKYSSKTPARYKSYGRRIKSDKRFEAENNSIKCNHETNKSFIRELIGHTNEFVSLRPSLNCSGQQWMSKSESSWCKSIDNTWIDLWVIPEGIKKKLLIKMLQLKCFVKITRPSILPSVVLNRIFPWLLYPKG